MDLRADRVRYLIRDKLAGLVKRRNAMDVAGSSHAMIRAVRNAGRPRRRRLPHLRGRRRPVDLKAQLLDLPLHHLLGAADTRVPVYGSGGFAA